MEWPKAKCSEYPVLYQLLVDFLILWSDKGIYKTSKLQYLQSRELSETYKTGSNKTVEHKTYDRVINIAI